MLVGADFIFKALLLFSFRQFYSCLVLFKQQSFPSETDAWNWTVATFWNVRHLQQYSERKTLFSWKLFSLSSFSSVDVILWAEMSTGKLYNLSVNGNFVFWNAELKWKKERESMSHFSRAMIHWWWFIFRSELTTDSIYWLFIMIAYIIL